MRVIEVNSSTNQQSSSSNSDERVGEVRTDVSEEVKNEEAARTSSDEQDNRVDKSKKVEGIDEKEEEDAVAVCKNDSKTEVQQVEEGEKLIEDNLVEDKQNEENEMADARNESRNEYEQVQKLMDEQVDGKQELECERIEDRTSSSLAVQDDVAENAKIEQQLKNSNIEVQVAKNEQSQVDFCDEQVSENRREDLPATTATPKVPNAYGQEAALEEEKSSTTVQKEENANLECRESLEAQNISQKTDANMQTNKESMGNTQQIDHESSQIQSKSDNNKLISEEINNTSTTTAQTKDQDFQHKLESALEALPEQINSDEKNIPANDSHLVDNNADFLNEVMQAISSDAKQFITSGEQNSGERNSVAEANNVEKEQHSEVVKPSVETPRIEAEEKDEVKKSTEVITEKVSIDNRVDTPEIPRNSCEKYFEIVGMNKQIFTI